MSNELVKHQEAEVIASRPAYPQVDLTKRDVPEWTSLDMTSTQGKSLYMKAKSECEHDSAWFLAHEFSVQDVLVHVYEKADEKSGEVTWIPRMVLINPDGEMVAITALGALESMRDLCSDKLFGSPPWIGGRVLRLVSKKTGSNRHTYKIVIPTTNIEEGALDGHTKRGRQKTE